MDRNVIFFKFSSVSLWSLSARRAWIEIAEIVFVPLVNGSLSARRAWIEIARFARSVCVRPVALRKESVDRNLLFRLVAGSLITSLSARRAWIEMQISVTTVVGVLSLSARRAWIEIRR